MKKILILTDDRGQFYSSTREMGGSMNVDKIKTKLTNLGYSVKVLGFTKINFSANQFKNYYVLYQSTEDPDLRYNDYIEDIILGLEQSGSILIPKFKYFRAHHNKVFMEILRDTLDLGYPTGFMHFGTLEELMSNRVEMPYPLVIKPSQGSKGKNIFLVQDRKQLVKKARKISSSFTSTNILRSIKSVLNLKKPRLISNNRKKFIVQKYIPGLTGDYKVLVYGNKYFVVKRENRPGDFRASGSGLITFVDDIDEKLLDYADSVFCKCDVPFMGLDIADYGDNYALIEFQFVAMGNYALEKSRFYFEKVDNVWQKVCENSVLEDVFVNSIDNYLKEGVKTDGTTNRRHLCRQTR